MRRAIYKPVRDFSVILMLAAIAGAIAHVVGMAVEIGRAAGWWF